MKNILACCLGLSLLLSASFSLADWKEDYQKAHGNKNFAEAFRIAKGQAEIGDSEAQMFLGLLYTNGQGVSKNEVEGLTLLMVAAKNGSATAGQQSDFIQTRLKKEQIQKADEGAKNHRWKRNR